jgi:hypothetical protein
MSLILHIVEYPSFRWSRPTLCSFANTVIYHALLHFLTGYPVINILFGRNLVYFRSYCTQKLDSKIYRSYSSLSIPNYLFVNEP